MRCQDLPLTDPSLSHVGEESDRDGSDVMKTTKGVCRKYSTKGVQTMGRRFPNRRRKRSEEERGLAFGSDGLAAPPGRGDERNRDSKIPQRDVAYRRQ